LAELGVRIDAPNPAAKGSGFRLMIPHRFHPGTYIDIAYLMSQLVDKAFEIPPVEYIDSYPHGVKYRARIPTKDAI
jgi:hypothetical protein